MMDRLSQDSPIEQFFSAFPPDMAPLRERLLRQKNLLDGFGFVTPVEDGLLLVREFVFHHCLRCCLGLGTEACGLMPLGCGTPHQPLSLPSPFSGAVCVYRFHHLRHLQFVLDCTRYSAWGVAYTHPELRDVFGGLALSDG